MDPGFPRAATYEKFTDESYLSEAANICNLPKSRADVHVVSSSLLRITGKKLRFCQALFTAIATGKRTHRKMFAEQGSDHGVNVQGPRNEVEYENCPVIETHEDL